MAVAGEADIRTQAAAGTTKRMIVGLNLLWRLLFPGSGDVLVGPADGGIHRHSPAELMPSASSAAARKTERIRSQVPSTTHLSSRL